MVGLTSIEGTLSFSCTAWRQSGRSNITTTTADLFGVHKAMQGYARPLGATSNECPQHPALALTLTRPCRIRGAEWQKLHATVHVHCKLENKLSSIEVGPTALASAMTLTLTFNPFKMSHVLWSFCLCVCLCVGPVKTAEQITMTFGGRL